MRSLLADVVTNHGWRANTARTHIVQLSEWGSRDRRRWYCASRSIEAHRKETLLFGEKLSLTVYRNTPVALTLPQTVSYNAARTGRPWL